MKQSCLKYKKNVNSQNSEDGIIEYIFGKLGIIKGNFIEFGAWDGKHLSNCYKLLNEGWSGIYIEADENKFSDLVTSFRDCESVTLLNKMVLHKGDNKLDNIIDECIHFNKDFDFISIVVDGLDYNIFQSMHKYLPKVLCIEVNAGHSPMYDVEYVEDVAKYNIGQSMTIICKEAEKKGYFPLCYTGNLFLVKNEYREHFIDDIKGLQEIYEDFLTHLNDDELQYLYDLFVVKKYFNGVWFDNDILKNFCARKM